jgi:hypothetical protein
VQRAQPNGEARHAGLGPDPLIRKPGQETQPAADPCTNAPRSLLRLEFFPRFGQAPSLADGIWLRTWRSGAKAGQPKIPAAAASMLARGLLELRPAAGPGGTRAYFTEAGYAAALRLLAQDRRALDPKQYAHVRQELGLEPDPAGVPTTKRSGIPRCRVR